VIHRALRDGRGHRMRCRPRAPSELAMWARRFSGVVGPFQRAAGDDRVLRRAFTLASYMIEGGGSRNYIETKKLMYRQTDAWRMLLGQALYRAARICRAAGGCGRRRHANFDSWAGALSVEDYQPISFCPPRARWCAKCRRSACR